MTTEFRVCANCQKLRALDHMAKSGRCVFCPRSDAPSLLPPPAPLPVTHWAIKPESDAVRRVREANG